MIKFLPFCMIILITGCTSFNSEFNCPAFKGTACKRLSDIDQEYNEAKNLNLNGPLYKPLYAKSDHIDVHIKGFEDKTGVYHHPRTITIKTKDDDVKQS